MTTLDSSSGVEYSMDDNSNGHGHGHGHGHDHLQALTKAHSFNTTATTTTTAANNNNGRFHGSGGFRTDGFVEDEEDEGNCDDGDAEVWGTLKKSFSQIQSVLDRNRVLIQQVNENHQSKIPDNLVKNVALIQEINGNISKVVSLYSDLSVNFSSLFHQRDGAVDGKSGTGKGDDLQA